MSQRQKQKIFEASQATATPLLLRGTEVAELLGISRALAYRWMAAGVLPTIRVRGSRSVRVPRGALLNWIEQRTCTCDGAGVVA
jgi:excisionase family DNA binding protein